MNESNELLDVVDENGEPTGETVGREAAHRDGVRHRTAHVWLVRLGMLGQMQVLVQKRAADKDSFPGCWDVSSAGHVPAGQDWTTSALRELKEELGVEARPEDLQWLGVHPVEHDGVFHGKPFCNRQVSAVFALRCDKRADEFAVQKSEIESVEWTDLDDCIEVVRKKALPNCISLWELKRIDRKVWLYPPGEGPYRSPMHSAFKRFTAGLVANGPLFFATLFCCTDSSGDFNPSLSFIPVAQIVAIPLLLALWGYRRPRIYRREPGPWAWLATRVFFLAGLFISYNLVVAVCLLVALSRGGGW